MVLRAVLIVMAMAGPVTAQVVSPDLERANPEMTAAAEREVHARIDELLASLGHRDVAGVRRLLAPKMLVAVARRERDGSFTTSYLTRDEFLAQLEKNAAQPPFEEPLANRIITIESDQLAHVRAHFTIRRGGQVQSSGVDHFTLLKDKDGWKIAVIAYTSFPAQP